MIVPGSSPATYTDSHVDLYSYSETALHYTSVLYLGDQVETKTIHSICCKYLVSFGVNIHSFSIPFAVQIVDGGDLVLEREDEDEVRVSPQQGSLDLEDDGEVRVRPQQGELVLEREGEEQVRVRPQQGSLVTFTSGEENRHRVERVKEGVRVAVTLFYTCDQDYTTRL